jgi:Cof subfamily protein (haloacid dehalogenase superfamily)
MKGWIALDIDGTITAEKYSIPEEVVTYLRELQDVGWNIAIATGRSYVFSLKVLSSLKFPYRLLIQNGSAAISMPSKKLIHRHYLAASSIALVEEAFRGIEGSFLVYSGVEEGGFCYYRPKLMSNEQIAYVTRLEEREQEKARSIGSFEKIGDFPLFKCFGSEIQMIKLAKKLRQTNVFQVAHIRDSFEENGQILLVTDLLASKGEALKRMIRLHGRGEKVIAAGDDQNDESLLQQADIKIVMPQAPEMLKKQADLIAPPVSEMGIISALEQATGHVR